MVDAALVAATLVAGMRGAALAVASAGALAILPTALRCFRWRSAGDFACLKLFCGDHWGAVHCSPGFA
jgi:hypothetical protein